jgi:hypothetical protein
MAIPLFVTGIAFFLYMASAPPGLTWAHFGADGAELLTAAISNGVPHPPGYPLYILLLQGWLQLASGVTQGQNFAWYGNLLSCLLAAVSVGVTSQVVSKVLLAQTQWPWLWGERSWPGLGRRALSLGTGGDHRSVCPPHGAGCPAWVGAFDT